MSARALLPEKLSAPPTSLKLKSEKRPPPLCAAELPTKEESATPRKDRATYAPPPLSDAALPLSAQDCISTWMMLALGGAKMAEPGLA